MKKEKVAQYKKLLCDVVAYVAEKYKGKACSYGEVALDAIDANVKYMRYVKNKAQKSTVREALAVDKKLSLYVVNVMSLFKFDTTQKITNELITEENIKKFCKEQERLLKVATESEQ
ncbi:MAG: hypothetical protein J6A28_04365 [Clostridia bacterium]|nr:hypothetical protein [Clostridia bacterium]